MGIRSRIGYHFSESTEGAFQTFNCRENRLNEELYFKASRVDVQKAAEIAHAAFFVYKDVEPALRAQFLNEIADGLEQSKSPLIAQFCKESSLSESRGEIELNRTIFQLRTFAEVANTESWRNPIISNNLSNGLDIRSCNEAIGPVAVFGASNFPFAYSTIGGDSAAALAIGCPVIVKAHPMHAGTSEMVAKIILDVAQELKLPDGVFSHLLSNTHSVGEELVKHEAIKAVGFTGSIRGGRALMDLAALRKHPIPVFAEMGSVNPVVLCEEELSLNLADWVQKYAQSISNDAGQFCTKPGLLFVPNSKNGNDFVECLRAELHKMDEIPQLHPAIHSGFLTKQSELFESTGEQLENHSQPVLQIVHSKQYQSDKRYREEFFGPQSIAVFYDSQSELIANLEMLEGQLTATIIATATELKDQAIVLEVLKAKAGRIVVNGVPTGVTVCDAMVHGGTYPASSDARYTAVGSQSVFRFARPVAYQNCPMHLLPVCLRDE